MIDSASSCVSSAVNEGSSSSVRKEPATRRRGGAPALICRSEPSSSASITRMRSRSALSTSAIVRAQTPRLARISIRIASRRS